MAIARMTGERADAAGDARTAHRLDTAWTGAQSGAAMPGPFRSVLRLVLGSLQRIRKAVWYFTRPRTFGAHAVAITPRRTIVLVRLRYAEGWRLPGGGVKEGENPREAALRELREEIGMTAHGPVEPAGALRENPDFKRDTASLFIVRDVQYRPKWSLEVEAVTEADPDALPPDISDRTLELIAALRPLL